MACKNCLNFAPKMTRPSYARQSRPTETSWSTQPMRESAFSAWNMMYVFFLLFNAALPPIYPFLHFQDDKISSLSKLRDLPDELTAAAKVVFSADSKTLYLVKRNRTVDVFKVLTTDDDEEIHYQETIDAQKYLKSSISQIVVSNCGQFLVCAGLCCNISVWKRVENSSWTHHINLPKYPLVPVAMAIHMNAPKLVVAFADAKIFEYHLEEWRFLCSTSQQFVKNQDTHVIRNIVLDPRNEDIFILHNETFLFTVKKTKVFNRNLGLDEIIFIDFYLF